MRALVLALSVLVVAAVPCAAWAQDEEAGEGTYSTYSSDEAQVAPAGYEEVELVNGQPRYVTAEQRLFDTFWYELSKYGRWEEDPTYSWVWYPSVAPGFRPYADGWWVYTTEGWTYETEAPYGWAVYHYGRWAYLSGGWAWLPGYEWSPGWVTMRVSGDFIGWAPLGPAGYVWDYWPIGWGYTYSPWLFVSTVDFGRRHHRHHYCDRDRGNSAFHGSEPVHSGHGSGRGGTPTFKDIPHTHHAEPIPVVEGSKPVDPSAPSTGTVVIYRPRPNVGGPSVGTPSGGAGGARPYVPRPERPSSHPAPGNTVGQPWAGSRPGPAVTPPRPNEPSAPPVAPPALNRGDRFQVREPMGTPSAGPIARPPVVPTNPGYRTEPRPPVVPTNPGYRTEPRPAPVVPTNPGYRAEPRPTPQPSYSHPTPAPSQPAMRPVAPPAAQRPQIAPPPPAQPQPQPAKPSHSNGPQRGKKD
ncbi:MAG: hypothetical protein QM765_12390 [Myxococcales bacterium]